MPWQCIQCSELIEEPFDACWNCGTWRDGERNRRFRNADRIRPERWIKEERATISLRPAKIQFSTRSLLTLTTGFAVACLLGLALWVELALAIAILAVATIFSMLLMGFAINFVYGLADAIRKTRRRR